MEFIDKTHSLEVFDNNTLIFSSSSKWLYPLFELSEFLAKGEYNTKQLFLHDRVQGRAAALLTLALNIENVYADLISERALSVYNKSGSPVSIQFGSSMDKIQCQTEELLSDKINKEEAISLLSKRANKVFYYSL